MFDIINNSKYNMSNVLMGIFSNKYYLPAYLNKFNAIKYENIPIKIATNHDGNTVDNLRPTPNCRNEPSLL